jgi:hemolysin D
MKSARALLNSGAEIIRLPLRKQRREDELAFLPAALEITETPPSPLGRTIGATIIALFCLALLWAAIGRVDIIASAPGKIVPSGRVKLIQPFETGVVRAINVRDGQHVKAGDALIELDPTMSEAEESHIRSDLISAKLDVARLTAALNDVADANFLLNPPAGTSSELVDMQKKFLVRQIDEFKAKLASLDAQLAQKEAERASVTATIRKLEATHPLLHERAEILKGLTDRQLASKLTYLETAQLLAENEADLSVQKSRLNEADAAVTAVANTRAEAEAEYHRKIFSDLEEAERKAAGLGGDLAKAEQRTKLQVLTAPVDGVVQQLSVHTLGGVVKPAEQLAVVVPSDSTLEVDAMISNREVGFVHEGQDAKIKVDAFNFTRYGMLHGNVISLSPDAILQDASASGMRKPSDAAEGASAPKNQELNYEVRISLDRTQIPIENTFASLSPGMTVAAEIKTGSRSVLSYLLSPLLRSANESLHER